MSKSAMRQCERSHVTTELLDTQNNKFVRRMMPLTGTEALELHSESILLKLSLHPVGRNDAVRVDRIARPECGRTETAHHEYTESRGERATRDKVKRVIRGYK